MPRWSFSSAPWTGVYGRSLAESLSRDSEDDMAAAANILNRAFNARQSQGDGVALTSRAHPEVVTGSGDVFRDFGLEGWDGHQPEDL